MSIRKYVSYGHDIAPSRLIHIDPGRFEPNNIMSYITTMVSSYFLAHAVPSFTPIIIYMGILGALILAAQILDVRKRMKKIEPIFRATFRGARNMNQKQYVTDKDLLTNSKKMKIEAERLRILVGRSMNITRQDYLAEYLASKEGEIRD